MIHKFKPKSEFSRNVLTLMTGTTIAQAIPIAISPILTRLYTPEDFGVFALYMSLVSIIAVLATGRYELAIMLPEKNEDAANILTLSILITFVISFIVFWIVFIFNDEITRMLGNQEISTWLYFIPLSVLLTGMYQSFNYWNNRNKEYKLMSKAMVLQSSSNAVGNVSFGFANLAFAGLILTNIITRFISLFYLVFKNKTSIKKYKKNINITQMNILMHKYKQFPLHTLPQNFIYQGTLQLPIFVIKSIFSFTILGLFSLAYRVIATPISIIGNTLGQVFYQKASVVYQKDKGKLYFYTRKMFIKLLLLSIIMGSLLTWFLPDLFSFIFGEKWIQAGVIAQYLMIYITFNFALSPFTKLYLISNNNLFYLKWETIRFMSLSLLFIVLYLLGIENIETFFLYFSILHLFLYILIAIPILDKKSFIWKIDV